MGVLRARALCALVLCGCAPKPLRFTDAATEAAALADATSDAWDERDGADATDAALDAGVERPDALAVDIADAGDVRADVVASDVVGVVPTSCASDPLRADCRTVAVDPTRSFCLGVDAAAWNAGWSASPSVCGLSLSPFTVDAQEVSVARFRPFYERWTARTLAGVLDVRFARGVSFRSPLPPRTVLSEWNPSAIGCNWTDAPTPARDRHPINCVGWALAMYFCAWEGGHLLTSAQHEYLARWHGAASTDGRSYPWGEGAAGCSLVHYGPCAGEDGLLTRRVGSLPMGAVASVFDLAGNVADWVADDFATYDLLEASACWTSRRVDPLCAPTLVGAHYARGSSHMNPSELVLRTVFRPGGASGDASASRGFRCAYLR